MKDNYIIWGINNIGRTLFYNLSNNGEVLGWYDEETNVENIYGCPVTKYDEQTRRGKIVVAESNWNEICEQLRESGLKIVKDYMPYWLFNKKMIGWRNLLELSDEDRNICLTYLKNKRKISIIYGNCQTELIQRFLAESDEFISNYIIINIPRVCQEDEEQWKAITQSGLFQYCDLFIYQIVSDENKYGYTRATSNLIGKLVRECKTISIPNIYFDGYFPQLVKNEHNVLEDVQEDGLFKWGDRFVEQLIKTGMDKEHIVERVLDDSFLQKDIIDNCVKNAFDNLQRREKLVDIKISDYIMNNYKERQLFFAPNHPNNELILEIVMRLLGYLGMSTVVHVETSSSFVSLMGEDVVVYPSVIKYLGLKYYYERFFPNRYIENLAYSAQDYYRLYCDLLEKQMRTNGLTE